MTDFQVFCNDKPINTPLKNKLIVPTKKLADLINLEWQTVQENKKINPAVMPFTQIASTAIDKISAEKHKYIEDCVEFIHTDLLCYRSNDENLRKIQEEKYQKILNNFMENIGVFLATTDSILPINQNNQAVIKIKEALGKLDEWFLTALFLSVHNTGSLVLAWAFVSKILNAKDVFELMFIDENYQELFWGLDDEEKVRRENIFKQIKILEEFIEAIG